jgi:hypothetical protein
MRKPKPVRLRLSEAIGVRLTSDELAAVRKAADDALLTVSTWARRVLVECARRDRR